MSSTPKYRRMTSAKLHQLTAPWIGLGPISEGSQECQVPVLLLETRANTKIFLENDTFSDESMPGISFLHQFAGCFWLTRFRGYSCTIARELEPSETLCSLRRHDARCRATRNRYGPNFRVPRCRARARDPKSQSARTGKLGGNLFGPIDGYTVYTHGNTLVCCFSTKEGCELWGPFATADRCAATKLINTPVVGNHGHRQNS